MNTAAATSHTMHNQNIKLPKSLIPVSSSVFFKKIDIPIHTKIVHILELTIFFRSFLGIIGGIIAVFKKLPAVYKDSGAPPATGNRFVSLS